MKSFIETLLLLLLFVIVLLWLRNINRRLDSVENAYFPPATVQDFKLPDLK